MGDSWELTIKREKEFSLFYYNSHLSNGIVTTGTLEISDSSIRFICDTSKIKNKRLLNSNLKKFTNIPFILSGDTFSKQNKIFVPRNINFNVNNLLETTTGIYARYYRGDGYGNYSIELNKDGTYKFTEQSCLTRIEENGTWKLSDSIISFQPDNENNSMLDWITENRKLILVDEHLVGKKVERKMTTKQKVIFKETYNFMAKEPVYKEEIQTN